MKTIGEQQHDSMIKAKLSSINESLKRIVELLELLTTKNNNE